MIRPVIHYTDAATFGGAEQILLHLLSALDRRSWRPILVHHPAESLAGFATRAAECGVEVHPVPRAESARAHLGLAALARILQKARPAVFHAHLNWPRACRPGLLTAAAFRTPAVVGTFHLVPEEPPDLPERVKLRLLATCMDGCIAVSEWVAAKLREGYGLPAEKITVVRNGIPVTAYDGAPDPALRSWLASGTNRPIVLTLARLDAQKGHRYLLEAAVQVPEAIFVVAGDGPERNALEALAARYGLSDRVRFLGHREDVPALLAASDLCVLPSLFEGLPLTVLEAMAAGKPLVATRAGGVPEAIQDGSSGLLVAPRDPKGLAAAIRRLIDDPGLATRLANTAQARVRQAFSAQRLATEVEQVYEGLLSNRRPLPLQPVAGATG
jgi:glycosyltransferase involved in cell wall biosynthesis